MITIKNAILSMPSVQKEVIEFFESAIDFRSRFSRSSKDGYNGSRDYLELFKCDTIPFKIVINDHYSLRNNIFHCRESNLYMLESRLFEIENDFHVNSLLYIINDDYTVPDTVYEDVDRFDWDQVINGAFIPNIPETNPKTIPLINIPLDFSKNILEHYSDINQLFYELSQPVTSFTQDPMKGCTACLYSIENAPMKLHILKSYHENAKRAVLQKYEAIAKQPLSILESKAPIDFQSCFLNANQLKQFFAEGFMNDDDRYEPENDCLLEMEKVAPTIAYDFTTKNDHGNIYFYVYGIVVDFRGYTDAQRLRLFMEVPHWSQHAASIEIDADDQKLEIYWY